MGIIEEKIMNVRSVFITIKNLYLKNEDKMGHYGIRNTKNSRNYCNMYQNYENEIKILQESKRNLCLQLQEKEVKHENEIYHFQQIKQNLSFQLQNQDDECNQLKANF